MLWHRNQAIFIPTFTASQSGNVYAKGNIYCDGNLTDPNIYTKTAVDTAVEGKQPLINMLTALPVDTITVVGAITAAGFTTAGTATLVSINTDIM